MADKSGDNQGSQDAGARRQDPRVERLRPDPAARPARSQVITGLLGDSDRDGRRRLYLTSALDVYVEFGVEDVLTITEIPADQRPFLGEQATRVELRDEAPVDFTRSRVVGDVDEFDLDLRLPGRGVRFAAEAAASSGMLACVKPGEIITDPCDYTCDSWVCHTSLFAGNRCEDYTFGGPATSVRAGCPGGGGGRGTDTCATCDTCDTCATQCGTCYTQLGQTDCGGCYTQVAYTQCGTCYTDVGETNCGGCNRARG